MMGDNDHLMGDNDALINVNEVGDCGDCSARLDLEAEADAALERGEVVGAEAEADRPVGGDVGDLRYNDQS